jgi:LAO/AO transport system kinase
LTPSRVEALVDATLKGDRRALARLISMVEDGGPDLARVMEAIRPHTGTAYTIGITGAPGAGKSTLTERLVGRARRDGVQVGVLAVDPSSPFSGGALLGDRVRMQAHATDDGVFIRSMATRGHLGGISVATPEAVRVLEASGKEIVLIETVGVGQAEVEIADACDATLVVVVPGWGDAVQTAKAGLMEIADVFVVNKADRPGAKDTVRELRQMLDLSGADAVPRVVETVAVQGEGIDELWEAIADHRAQQEATGTLDSRRRRRIEREIAALVAERQRERVRGEMPALLADLVDDVWERKLDVYAAADRILEALQ